VAHSDIVNVLIFAQSNLKSCQCLAQFNEFNSSFLKQNQTLIMMLINFSVEHEMPIFTDFGFSGYPGRNATENRL